MINQLEEDLGLNQVELNSKREAFILTIESRITELIDSNFELLLSHLYRLDVPEVKINQALSSDNPINTLANYILDRQLSRLESKKKYQNSLDNEFKDLAW